MPSHFRRNIQRGDQEWIARCLYDGQGQLKPSFPQSWFHPPVPSRPRFSGPDPAHYFRQRMFIWAPMRMWGIPLKCARCGSKMHQAGIYQRVREVIDLDTRYYLVGAEYVKCSK